MAVEGISPALASKLPTFLDSKRFSRKQSPTCRCAPERGCMREDLRWIWLWASDWQTQVARCCADSLAKAQYLHMIRLRELNTFRCIFSPLRHGCWVLGPHEWEAALRTELELTARGEQELSRDCFQFRWTIRRFCEWQRGQNNRNERLESDMFLATA